MAVRSLNLVSLDVPYPPDYGGAIDIYYKLRALHAAGIAVYLHCFEYGRPARPELDRYCREVHYYPRRTGWLSQLSLRPYIVHSRRSETLRVKLLSNSHPIVFEGLHSAYLLLTHDFGNRPVLLRSHNLEHDYYWELASREPAFLKKIYLMKEAWLLKRVLRQLPPALRIGAISPADTRALQARFPNTFWLPPFHSDSGSGPPTGQGTYALYHGNLSVSENYHIAERLIREFAARQVPLIVAGKLPPPALKRLAEGAANVTLFADPSRERMAELIGGAQVLLLITEQRTGIKLKLLESLYRGRFCLANREMIEDTGLEAVVIRCEHDIFAATKTYMDRPFTQAEWERRYAILRLHYDNAVNARLLVDQLGDSPPPPIG